MFLQEIDLCMDWGLHNTVWSNLCKIIVWASTFFLHLHAWFDLYKVKNQVTHASSTCCKKITFYSQKIKRTLGIQSWEATGFAVQLFPFSFVLKARCVRGQSTLRSLRYSRSNSGQNFNELFFHLFLVLPQISKASTMPLSFSFGTFSDQHMWSKTCAILRTPSVNFVSKNGQYLTQGKSIR